MKKTFRSGMESNPVEEFITMQYAGNSLQRREIELKSETLYLRLRPSLKKRLMERCKQYNYSLSDFVALVLVKALDDMDKRDSQMN